MAKISTYKCVVDMRLILNNSEITIPTECITSIIVDHDYENKTMPILYSTLNITTTLYNQLVLNVDSGKIYMNIKYYDINSNNSIQRDNIKDQFVYFIPSSATYIKDLESSTLNKDNTFRNITIGLMKIELLNFNKQSFNGVYRNTDTKNLLNIVTTGRDLVISPLVNNTKYKEFFMPPRSSRSEAIKYIFKVEPFYDSKYSYFTDFDKSYLSDFSGTKIPSGTNMDTVMFDIKQIDVTQAYYEGMVKDTNSNCYIIYVNVSDSKLSVNTTTEKNTNQIIGVSETNVTISNLEDINNTEYSTSKQLFLRANSGETSIAASNIESSSVVINLSKPNIDAGVLTPDKVYTVKNYNDYAQYNGKFILICKKEVITKVDNTFTTTTTVGLRKISS